MKNIQNIKKDNVGAGKKNVNAQVDNPGNRVKKQDITGENCPVNPAEGINYLPPKDENKL